MQVSLHMLGIIEDPNIIFSGLQWFIYRLDSLHSAVAQATPSLVSTVNHVHFRFWLSLAVISLGKLPPLEWSSEMTHLPFLNFSCCVG